MAKYNVPVVQIDEVMMEDAVSHGGRILVVDIRKSISCNRSTNLSQSHSVLSDTALRDHLVETTLIE